MGPPYESTFFERPNRAVVVLTTNFPSARCPDPRKIQGTSTTIIQSLAGRLRAETDD